MGIILSTFTTIQAGDDYTARDRRPTCVLESFAGVTVLGTPTFFTRPRVNRDDCRIRSREKHHIGKKRDAAVRHRRRPLAGRQPIAIIPYKLARLSNNRLYPRPGRTPKPDTVVTKGGGP